MIYSIHCQLANIVPQKQRVSEYVLLKLSHNTSAVLSSLITIMYSEYRFLFHKIINLQSPQEVQMIKLSTSKELEELRSKKVELEEESHSLTEEHKNLEEKVKTLEEKIAIQELTNSNKGTREVISQLESKINDLERRLNEVSKEPAVFEPRLEVKPELAETPEQTEEMTPETAETTSEEPEDVVTVAPLEEPMLAQEEEFGENLTKQREKKKRKFF